MESILSVEHLTKKFTVVVGRKGLGGAVKNLFHPQTREITAVNDISFSVQEGEIVGFLGPNGAGKSTTIKMLTGILTPSSGSATVGGLIPYQRPRENARNIGVVFGQRSRLWWNLPVQDSFEYTKALYQIPEEVFQENLRYFSDSFGVGDILTKPVRTLSLGQKMRAEIAMAMLHNPRILYLDEPTIGLDVVGKNELHQLIQRINADRGVTIVLVTHDVLDIERLCRRVMIIDKGQLIWRGEIDALKRAKGVEKHYHVLYESPCDPISAPFLKVEEAEGQRHHYICTEDVPLDDILPLILAAGKVVDFTVNDPPLDQVMRRIYTE